jgi:hypothetical protein
MKKEFIDFLKEKGWSLVSVENGLYKFDKVGPFHLYVKNDSLELYKFNSSGWEAGEPFFHLVKSFTGMLTISFSSFVHLAYALGIVESDKSNARHIGDLLVDTNNHCKPVKASE